MENPEKKEDILKILVEIPMLFLVGQSQKTIAYLSGNKRFSEGWMRVFGEKASEN